MAHRCGALTASPSCAVPRYIRSRPNPLVPSIGPTAQTLAEHMSPRRRADIVLVERGLFESRAKAQAAIAAGLVSAGGEPVRKASEPIADDAAISAAPAFPWVSRG